MTPAIAAVSSAASPDAIISLDDESADSPKKKKKPIELAIEVVVRYAKEEKIVRERDPKSGAMMVSKEACDYVGENCRYYQQIELRVGSSTRA